MIIEWPYLIIVYILPKLFMFSWEHYGSAVSYQLPGLFYYFFSTQYIDLLSPQGI